MKPKLIILEGADCVGKTTLANSIVEKYGAKYIHNTYYKGMDVKKEHIGSLLKACKLIDEGHSVVIDRFWITEQVYSSVYRDGPEYQEAIPLIELTLAIYSAKTILCIPSNTQYVISLHKKLQEEREEMYSDISKVVSLYEDLWYGRENEYLIEGTSIDYYTKLGGFSEFSSYVKYDVLSDGLNIDLFLEKIYGGVNDEIEY